MQYEIGREVESFRLLLHKNGNRVLLLVKCTLRVPFKEESVIGMEYQIHIFC